MEHNMSQILKLAEEGKPSAQYNAGVCFQSGRYGADQNYEEAAKWYLKAAEHGHVKAAFCLGRLYQNGKGVEQDYVQAATWYSKAADAGNDNARICLGMLYEKGLGVQQDYEQAAYLYHDAAENGNEKALELLNKLLDEHDPPKDEHSGRKIPSWLKFSGIAAVLAAVIIGSVVLAWRYWPQGNMAVNDIVAKVIPATVFISVETATGGATGSGFFVKGGKIFTNAHVIHDARSIRVKTHTGKTYDAEVLDENSDFDLAVLTANIDKREYSELAFAPEIPQHGSGVVVIGSPLGYEQTVSDGLVSAVRRYDEDITILQITAPISPGSSGSPVVNMRGDVVGVATLTITTGQSLNFAVSPLSVKRSFQGRDIYLVENNVPIAENDRNADNLRVNKSSKTSAKSPADEKVRVIDTKQLEVRTLAKVRSLNNGKTYWINADSVKKPIAMTLEEFVEKFNDGSSFGSERINLADFKIEGRKATVWKNFNYIQMDLDKQGRNIDEVTVGILLSDLTEGKIHPLIQQTIDVFYPIPLISKSEFYSALTRYNLGNVMVGFTDKFPIKFLMAYSSGVAVLSLKFNNNSDEKKTAQNNPAPVKTDPPKKQTPSKKKKTNLRDPEYLNEIRAAFKGMPDIKEDIFEQEYRYYPQKYSGTANLIFWPYLTHNRQKGAVTLNLGIGFEADKWVFTKSITFNCDGRNFTINDFHEVERDVAYGKIYEMYYEWLAGNYTPSDLSSQSVKVLTNLVETIISSKKVQIRFKGDKRVEDRTLSKRDIQNLAKCWECYKKLVAVEDHWEN